MKKLVLAALVLSTTSGCFNGCNRKKEQEAIEPPPPTSLAPEAPTAAKPLTPDELVAHFQECWQLWNQAAWDKYKDCYAADATLDSPGTGEPTSKGAQAIVDATKELKTGFPDMTGEPKLVLVHGRDLVAVTQLTGTHTGPFAGVTAMNQKLGLLMGEVITVDDQGHATKEATYFDAATIMGQLGGDKGHPVRAPGSTTIPKETVIAKDDTAEQANLAVAKQELDAFNKHDAKACGAVLADDLVWSEQEEAKDWTKAELLADHAEAWKAFSDLKLTPSAMWAAGAYVVTVATFDGTNDGPMPMLAKPTKKKVSLPFLSIEKIDGGKIKTGWVFMQSMAVMQQLGIAPPEAGSATGSAK
ncbi:MAG TPA: ester cyclase [Kofleriaceae bacterium]|jgi:predicted ester cyclase